MREKNKVEIWILSKRQDGTRVFQEGEAGRGRNLNVVRKGKKFRKYNSCSRLMRNETVCLVQ